jgi:CO dehydrogenase/acetyl-CoA synthase beta subunit
MRINEGVCDPDGLFYCGSMAYDQRQGAASLYRMNPDGTHFALSSGDSLLGRCAAYAAVGEPLFLAEQVLSPLLLRSCDVTAAGSTVTGDG